jgi:NTE family protein
MLPIATCTGVVIHGKQLGRTIGFPTANICIDKDLISPWTYGMRITLDWEVYFWIGVYLDGQDILETHIFSFDQDIYDETITVEVMVFLRENKKFPWLIALKQQIENDKKSMELWIKNTFHDTRTQSRDNFSLALWWWAARGLAHIGVIQKLEELWKKPTFLCGTSIGALIGALYACGYTAREMQKIAEEAKIYKLIDFDLRDGMLKGKKIFQYLDTLLWGKTFADTLIPLSIIATNIETGEKIVFTQGKLIDAVRASISIPWIFTPYKHDGNLLVDGWLTENLPISICPKDHWVIAVSVQMDPKKYTKKSRKYFFSKGTIISNTYSILRKTINIMMTQNEKNSLNSHADVVIISPERYDIDYYNFLKIQPMIQEWYRVAHCLDSYFSHHV